MSYSTCKLLDLPDELLQDIFEYLYTEKWYLTLQKCDSRDARDARDVETIDFDLRPTSKVDLTPHLVCRRLYEVVRTMLGRRFNGILNVYDSPGLLEIADRTFSTAPFIRRLCLPDKNMKNFVWSDFPRVLPRLTSLQTVELFQVDSFLLVDISDAPFNYDSLAVDDDSERVYSLIMSEASNDYWQSRASPYIPTQSIDETTLQGLISRRIEIISNQVFCHLLFRARLPARLCSKDLNVAFLVNENRKLQVCGKRWIRSLRSDHRVLCELEWEANSSPYTGSAPRNVCFMTLEGTEEEV